MTLYDCMTHDIFYEKKTYHTMASVEFSKKKKRQFTALLDPSAPSNQADWSRYVHHGFVDPDQRCRAMCSFGKELIFVIQVPYGFSKKKNDSFKQKKSEQLKILKSPPKKKLYT